MIYYKSNRITQNIVKALVIYFAQGAVIENSWLRRKQLPDTPMTHHAWNEGNVFPGLADFQWQIRLSEMLLRRIRVIARITRDEGKFVFTSLELFSSLFKYLLSRFRHKSNSCATFCALALPYLWICFCQSPKHIVIRCSTVKTLSRRRIIIWIQRY